MRFTAALNREEDWYVARCLEVEVASQGGTVEEALNNVKEALELHFEDEAPPSRFGYLIIASVELAV